MQIHPLEFVQRGQIIDRNLVIFRDLFDHLYQRGIGPGIESMPRFIDWQRELRGRFPSVRRLYCIGASGGGYAAVVSGHALDADVVWALAPIAVVPSECRVGPEVHGLPQEEYERQCDLARLLASGNGRTEYRIFYNRGYEPDREALTRLEGLPGVSTFPREGRDHFVVEELARTGALDTLLPRYEPV